MKVGEKFFYRTWFWIAVRFGPFFKFADSKRIEFPTNEGMPIRNRSYAGGAVGFDIARHWEEVTPVGGLGRADVYSRFPLPPPRHPCARSLVGVRPRRSDYDDARKRSRDGGGDRGGGQAISKLIKIEWAAPEGGSNRTGKSLVTRGCALRP